MNEIRCPNCGKVFQVDEAGYAAIVSQVHNEQFEKELADRAAAVRREMEASGRTALAELSMKHERELAAKEQEILRLKEGAKAAGTEKELAVKMAVQEKDTEIMALRGQIVQEKQAAEIREQGMKEAHKAEVSRLESEVEQYRDFKMRQSTKMIGESLEQHCLISFNQVRMMAFPRAYFEKTMKWSKGPRAISFSAKTRRTVCPCSPSSLR